MLYRERKSYSAHCTDDDIRADYDKRINEPLTDKFTEKECKKGLLFCNADYAAIIIKNKDGSRDKLVYCISTDDDLKRFEKYLKKA
jgi:hypothetical protein